MGFRALEIGYACPASALAGIKMRVDKGEIGITSVHAFSSAFSEEGGHPECFSIADFEEVDRVKAVEKVLENLAFAQEMGAPVVVLHAGRLRAASSLWFQVHDRIIHERDSGFFFRRKMRKMNEVRERDAPFAMDALRRSLCDLLPFFERAGVRLAIENLPSFDAIPLPEETDLLCAEFGRSSGFALWFDMGHAQVMENAGYGLAQEQARMSLPFLAGMHIHDVVGPAGDHQAPGLGGIDFRGFSFLAEGRACVFEPSSIVSEEDLTMSVEYMRRSWPGT